MTAVDAPNAAGNPVSTLSATRASTRFASPAIEFCSWIASGRLNSDAIIPPYYDSLVAKLIVHGADRSHALVRMRRALEMFIVEGVKTTIPLHRAILADPDFQAGRIHTGFLDRHLPVGK